MTGEWSSHGMPRCTCAGTYRDELAWEVARRVEMGWDQRLASLRVFPAPDPAKFPPMPEDGAA